MKAVITVTGKDCVGIIAGVSALCSENNANIIDITQSVLSEYFAMIMLVEIDKLTVPFNAFADKLAEVYITSQATVVKGDAPEGAFVSESGTIAVKVENADGCKCGRCWSYSTEGVTDDEGGFLCERCRKLLI